MADNKKSDQNKNFEEINEDSEHLDRKSSETKGIDLFFGKKEADFFAKSGREISENILKESFILYRVDKTRTKTHSLYGETKKKEYRDPVEIFARINVETNDQSYHVEGNLVKRGLGDLTAHIYIDHLEELGLIDIKDENEIITEIKDGDFIGFKGQYYEIYDNGHSQISNQYSWGGDRRFYITIKAKEVDEDVFRAR